jgi:type II secretory pathway predicted ATPase ExeA
VQTVLISLGLTQADLGKGADMTVTATHRLVTHGQWPARRTAAVHARVMAFLQASGAKAAQLAMLPALPSTNEKAPASSYLAEADHTVTEPVQNPKTFEDLPMLLRNEPLSPDARKHFGLLRSPFVNDVQSSADVFVSADIRYVRASLMDAANNHGFIAVVGESGAGKSTLVEELEERIKEGKQDVLVIKPYTLAMELNDVKGKTLKSGQIAECIAHVLDPNAALASSPQKRFQQIHDMLKASRKAGRKHLIVIEEAHCLPVATLKHLKRFLELKDGLQRLIGIALIAQPELRERLGSQNMEVREVMQRCEIVDMPPLDNELEAYLRHKFARSELKYDDVFTKDAADAIRARLVYMPRGGKAGDARSICYPLVVNNLVCRAMNAAAKVGFDKVDATVIAGC